ncbi:hypothetical protein FRACYDRAFT_241794 [Fragilariopsis cylindrus CCMP1102]|uniref:Uncharacterized protein n=1 Tax=Fragilariopsis cylindrus CCMP1102 TaxID=635003 RepID=A0A1E7F5P9_9STRA|nr:hypothetical protein FRACYDRAFT_241794 [Fragilariopsis cylindrus CCMP1102]|eukprot:OEU13459.1 hypothetical protein FRACYDRAFT_241794 [Fragilariopsis cylindrus CCMP1102]
MSNNHRSTSTRSTGISGNSSGTTLSRERGDRFVKPKLTAKKSMDLEFHCAEGDFDDSVECDLSCNNDSIGNITNGIFKNKMSSFKIKKGDELLENTASTTGSTGHSHRHRYCNNSFNRNSSNHNSNSDNSVDKSCHNIFDKSSHNRFDKSCHNSLHSRNRSQRSYAQYTFDNDFDSDDDSFAEAGSDCEPNQMYLDEILDDVDNVDNVDHGKDGKDDNDNRWHNSSLRNNSSKSVTKTKKEEEGSEEEDENDGFDGESSSTSINIKEKEKRRQQQQTKLNTFGSTTASGPGRPLMRQPSQKVVWGK